MGRKNLRNLVVISLLLVQSSLAQDAATILKNSKAATALAILPDDRGSGSAFCIDASGLFVTNAHVVKDLDEKQFLTLVLNPADTGQRKLQARVLATDEEADLALVQTTEGKDFTALTLGSVDGLSETQQLTALGYPFGSALRISDRTYPAITVNVVRISALRKSSQAVEVIQIDSQLNPGNSGGPVVDAGGKVVGVVSSGIIGGGINFAIPVGKVRTFLSTPRISFSSPQIPEDKRTLPVDLTIGVISFDKTNQAPMSVQITLDAKTPRERKVDATAVSPGQFKAKVIPVVSTEVKKLSVMITLSDSALQASVDDQVVKLDQRDLKLSSLSRLERSTGKATATLRDGTELSGKSLTISAIKADVGGQTIPLDPTKIQKIVINTPSGQQAPTMYSITVSRGGKVIATQDGTFGAASNPSQAAGPSTRSDDPILAKLEDAKDERDRSVERARRRLLDTIESRTQAAANRGNLDAVKAMEAAKESVEKDGKLPESIKDAPLLGAQNAFITDTKAADARLARAYDLAIRDYTRARQTSQAEAIKNEMTERGLGAEGTASPIAMMRLGGTNPLPSMFEPSRDAFSEGPIGLQFRNDGSVRTREGNWLNQDFTLDLVYSYKPGVDGIGLAGFGEGINKQNALLLRIHTPPLAEGYLGFNVFKRQEEHLAKVSSNGPHMLRMEKKGQTLTVSLCVDYKDKFTADYTKTIPDLQTAAPFLNAKNTYIWFGNGGLIYQQMRLVKSTPAR